MENRSHGISRNIAIAMLLGLVFGIFIRMLPGLGYIYNAGLSSALDLISNIFLKLLKMIVVPVVFVSLINGITTLQGCMKLGQACMLSMILYVIMTAIAIVIAITAATYFHVGKGANLAAAVMTNVAAHATLYDIVLGVFPDNIIGALVSGDMLQVLFLAAFIGCAILYSGKSCAKEFFSELNAIVISMVWMIMCFAPLAIFCIIVTMVAQIGIDVLIEIIDYVLVVALALCIHLSVSYNIMLKLFANIGIMSFLRNMHSAVLFAFSISSSSAALPLVMESAREKLKLSQPIVSCIVPLGAAINMDGAAIMHGVATVFIANAYNIDLTMTNYLTIIGMATLSSIGSAGVPGIAIITLAMVLSQVGLPAEGISLIIGVDILVDMMRTAINVCGGCVVACIVDKFFYGKNIATRSL